MTENLTAYRARLLQNKFYAASPLFVQSVRWQYERAGHVLIDNTVHNDVVAAVVGRVIEQRLCCAPNGNYIEPGSPWGTLATAKFQLQLGKPVGTVFANDFEKVIEQMSKIQAQVASTDDRRNFIIPDGGNKNLRFARKVFERRVRVNFCPLHYFYSYLLKSLMLS